jgi:transposase
MAKKYIVTLTEEERQYLQQMLSGGEERVRKLTRARILLKTDEGWTDETISEALDTSVSTIERTRRRFVEEGIEAALNRRRSTRRYERKLDGNAEAHLVALACSAPPEGRDGWTLRLLAETLVSLEQVDIDSISHETVRQVLKKRFEALAEEAVGDSTPTER